MGDLDYRLVLDTFADAVVAADGGGHIVYINSATEKLLGWARDELVGKPLTALMPPRMHAPHAEGFRRYLDTRRARIIGKPVRVPALQRNGAELDVELTLSAFQVAGGDLFVASLRDLRDRVELERQLVAQQRLSAQYEAMRVLAEARTMDEAAPRLLRAMGEALRWDVGALWRVDSEAGVLRPEATWAAPGFESFAAATRALTPAQGEGLPGLVWKTGAPVWSGDLLHDPRSERIEAAAAVGLRRAFFFPVFCSRRLHGLLELAGREEGEPDDDLRTLLATLGFQIGQFVDRLQAERDLLASESSLRESLRLRDDFLSIAGHELKTPLSALLLLLARAKRMLVGGDGAKTLERVGERLDKASANVERLGRLVDELLDVSRITANRLRLEPERLDLVELCREVVARFAEESARAGSSSSIVLRAAGPIWGRWDPLRLDQVVTNLLSNAIKYGAGKPIEIDVAARDGAAMVAVRDRGIGIEPEQQQRIFERFERAVSGRQFGGFGLGLWIARQLVEASGGTIAVDSRPGQGATFTVMLPVA